MDYSILVIEDNPDNQALVTWVLEDEDYDVTCSDNAERGIEALVAGNYDAVLMDICLPGMDGKEATRIIREMEKFKDVPILALTAHAMKEEEQLIMDSGVNELVPKPLDIDVLLTRLNFYLKK